MVATAARSVLSQVKEGGDRWVCLGELESADVFWRVREIAIQLRQYPTVTPEVAQKWLRGELGDDGYIRLMAQSSAEDVEFGEQLYRDWTRGGYMYGSCESEQRKTLPEVLVSTADWGRALMRRQP